jgi:hypothetical protein
MDFTRSFVKPLLRCKGKSFAQQAFRPRLLI